MQPGGERVGDGVGGVGGPTEAQTSVSVFPGQRGGCHPLGGDVRVGQGAWELVKGLQQLLRGRRGEPLGICLLVHKKEGVPKVQAFLSCLSSKCFHYVNSSFLTYINV